MIISFTTTQTMRHCKISTTHIAQMLLIGTFMGVITCLKDQSDHAGADEEILNLLSKLLKLEEANIESLKTYL